jgi:hypothetical protein
MDAVFVKKAREIVDGCLLRRDEPTSVTRPDLDHAIATALQEAAETARKDALEDAATECERQRESFLMPEYTTDQPFGSHAERFGCGICIDAIRALTRPECINHV